MDTTDLIHQFNESKAGHVINGSEAFRNRVGRMLHGLSYKYPKLTAVAGTGTFALATVAGGPAGAIVASPALFGGTYAAVAPKRFEKAACDFLMNQGVRKAAAFSNFLEKQGVDSATREVAVGKYLEQQSPKFGYYKEYQKEFPQAAKQIVEAGTKGDLPLRHSPDLYKNEIIQETLTKSRRKGGIVQGMIQTFSPETKRIQQEAEKLAEARWTDRQAWLAEPPETRGTWRSFYKEREFQRYKAQQTTPVATAALSATSTLEATHQAPSQSNTHMAESTVHDGEGVNKLTSREGAGNELPNASVDKGATLKQGMKAAGNFAMHAAAGIAGGYIGETLKDTGPVAESNGGNLLYQQSNELTLAKQKAFANLGAAGMATAATGIALSVGEKAIVKTVGKKVAVVGAKTVPVVGTVIGAGMAGIRAFNGDLAGAGLEIAGAAVDYIPWIGQAASLSIDATLAARDTMMKDGLCVFGAVNAQGKPITIKDTNGQDVQAVGAEITYKNDKKDGMAKWYDFDKDGKPYVALIGSYKDDAKTGEWVRMNADGKAVGIVHFDKDQPIGEILEVDNQGKPLTKGNLTQGQYVQYHQGADGLSTGVISQEGAFKDGKSVGVWYSYDKDGYPQSMVDYDKGYYEKYQPKTLAERPDVAPRIEEVGKVLNNGSVLKTGTERSPAPEPLSAEEKLNQEFGKIISDAQIQSSSHNAVPKTFAVKDTVTQPMEAKLGIDNDAPRGLAARLAQVSPSHISANNREASSQSPTLSAETDPKSDSKLSVAQMANKAGVLTDR